MAVGIDLKWELTLEKRQRIPDGVGGLSDVWVVLGTLWGDVRTGSMAVSAVAGGNTGRAQQTIVVRAVPEGAEDRPEIGQRFRYENRIYRIEGVSELDATGLHLACRTVEEVLS